MVADPKYAGLTMPQACWKLYKKEGIGSVFSGFSAMIAKQVGRNVTDFSNPLDPPPTDATNPTDLFLHVDFPNLYWPYW
jgi:hypothetical protein